MCLTNADDVKGAQIENMFRVQSPMFSYKVVLCSVTPLFWLKTFFFSDFLLSLERYVEKVNF